MYNTNIKLPSAKYCVEQKEWIGSSLADMGIDTTKPFGEYLLDELKLNGEKIIQINHDTGNRMTCNEMRMKCLKVAEHLEGLGIKRGDHVSVIANHKDDLASVFLGALALGGVVNPLHCDFSVEEFQYYFELIRPTMIICDENFIEQIIKALDNSKQIVAIYAFDDKRKLVREVDELICGYDTHPSEFVLPKYENDLANIPALIMCTSGTTGLPKAVLVSHAMAMCGMSRWWPVDVGSASFPTPSPYWLTAIIALANSIRCCSPRIITSQVITADLILDILEKYRVDSVFTSPDRVAMMANRLETRTVDLSNLRSIQTGGSRLTEKVHQDILEKIPSANVYIRYGMTDIGGLVTMTQGHNAKNSVGSLVAGVRAKVVNEKGDRMGPGELGEICVKKPCHVLGYLTKNALPGTITDADGWFFTGDIGYFDDKAELYLVDRKNDMIKHLGLLIAPSELERLIENNFDIWAVTVVGIPEDKNSFLPAAVIVARPGSIEPNETEIINAISRNYSEEKHLRGGVYFVDGIPCTYSGKVCRQIVQEKVIELFNVRNELNSKIKHLGIYD